MSFWLLASGLPPKTGANFIKAKTEAINKTMTIKISINNLFEFKGEKLQTAFKTLENRFKANDNIGLPRFENDIYYRFSNDYEANIWPITTLWRAEFYIALGEISKAEEIIEWVLKQQTSTGILPEQIDPRDLKHLSVAPLTWSQAEYVSALLDLVAFEEE